VSCNRQRPKNRPSTSGVNWGADCWRRRVAHSKFHLTRATTDATDRPDTKPTCAAVRLARSRRRPARHDLHIKCVSELREACEESHASGRRQIGIRSQIVFLAFPPVLIRYVVNRIEFDRYAFCYATIYVDSSSDELELRPRDYLDTREAIRDDDVPRDCSSSRRSRQLIRGTTQSMDGDGATSRAKRDEPDVQRRLVRRREGNDRRIGSLPA
jgi:hypothetical protein